MHKCNQAMVQLMYLALNDPSFPEVFFRVEVLSPQVLVWYTGFLYVDARLFQGLVLTYLSLHFASYRL